MTFVGLVERRVEPALRSFLETFRVVALVGPRQAGKTTLARQVTNGGVYLSLDDPDVFRAAVADPVGFVADRPRPVVIDEVQRGGDDLVRAVKLAVDEAPEPGSFLLTGSTNLLTVPTLSESLAGRMGLIELAPFSQAEAGGLESQGLVAWLVKNVASAGGGDWYEPLLGMPASLVSRRSYVERICAGGYPEVFRIEAGRRSALLRSLLTSIVARDIQEISGARRINELSRVAKALAARTSGEMVIADVHRDTAFGSPQTTADYVSYLEMVYLTVSLPAWATSAATRVKRRAKVHMADTGMAAALLGLTADALVDPLEPMRGPLHETFAAVEVRKQVSFADTGATLHHFRDRRGREIDLIVRLPTGKLLCFEVTSAMKAHGAKARTLGWFRDTIGDRFELGIVLYAGSLPLRLGHRLVALPISYLWEI